MSSSVLPYSIELRNYLWEKGLDENPVLKRLREETENHPFALMQICPEQGALMANLVRLISAKKAIEVGTFTGYSALAVALALPKNGYLLDGFPRTIPQAEGLDDIMNSKKHKLDVVVSLVAEENELIQRLINRGQDSGRTDDTPEIIKQRQEVYWNQTAPLIDFYSNKNVLVEVDGIGSIPEIKNRIFVALDSYA